MHAVRFDVNVSMLFAEWPFLDRFAQVERAGFGAVEFWWPSGEDPRDVERAISDAHLEVALFNFDAGDMAAGARGLAGDPALSQQFRENVPVALDLARRLSCRRLNAPVGLQLAGLDRVEQLEIARDNIRWAADQARSAGIDVLVEALNTFDNGPYLLPRFTEAVAFVKSVARDNVRLLWDVYHTQRMEGNLIPILRAHVGSTGHIQIADAPDRSRPGSGEINYRSVLRAIDESGYSGYVGLEYRAGSASTEESLEWLPRTGRGADLSVAELRL